MKLLLELPFTGTKNVNSLYKNKTAPTTAGEKDIYYRVLANQKINWCNLLLLFEKRYLQINKRVSQTKDNTRCLIFDDTEIAKTGRTIEGI